MLPKVNRLPLRFSRNFVEDQGKTFHSPLFTLTVAPSVISSTIPRVAFIVSKKIDKSSVVRNNLKRTLSNALSPYLKDLSPFDAIFYVKKQLAVADDSSLNTELTKILKTSKLLK